MEIRAYNEIYLESAQDVVGHMFDFAVNELGIPADEYMGIFAGSSYCREMERGNPAYVAGRTGPEITHLVLEEAGYRYLDAKEVMYSDKSPEYWVGWALAFYQWYTGREYKYIIRVIPFSDILKMYPVYHEMNIMKFVEALNEMIEARCPQTALRYYREVLNISQRELSERSGVPLRQIQLFEQRRRDIRKSQASTVLRLSKALGCKMEQLI